MADAPNHPPILHIHPPKGDDWLSAEELATLTPAILRERTLAQAMTLCRDAIQAVADGSGAGAHALDAPLQRYQRDCDTALGHVLYDVDSAFEQHGRALLGLAPDNPIF